MLAFPQPKVTMMQHYLQKLGISLFLLALTVVAYAKEPAATSLRVRTVQDYTFMNDTPEYGINKGAKGLAAFVPFRLTKYRQLTIVYVALDPQVARDWRVTQVICFEDVGVELETDMPAFYFPTEGRVFLFDLKPDSEFVLKILLFSESGASPDQLIAALNKNTALRVTTHVAEVTSD